jgi:hypothetical protein
MAMKKKQMGSDRGAKAKAKAAERKSKLAADFNSYLYNKTPAEKKRLGLAPVSDTGSQKTKKRADDQKLRKITAEIKKQIAYENSMRAKEKAQKQRKAKQKER